MSRRIHLVRHGLPITKSAVPACEWQLDPAGYPAIDALRDSGRLPHGALWFSSPEPKAMGTCERLTDDTATVIDDLREHDRGATWFDDKVEWARLIANAFAAPEVAAFPGWEPLAATRARVTGAVRRLLREQHSEEIVLVGHGTAWTILKAELTQQPPDLAGWADLLMPDLWVIEVAGATTTGRRDPLS